MNETDSSIESVISRAVEIGSSVEVLDRLLTLRAEVRAEAARAAFYGALATFQASIPAIPKTKDAGGGGRYAYRYADIATIQRTISPQMLVNGLSVTFDTRHVDSGYLVACIVHHLGGHSERTEFLVPIDIEARMNVAQKAGSVLTYGRRYAMCAALGIVTAEDDDDAQSLNARAEGSTAPARAAQFTKASVPAGPPARISPAQHKRLEALLNDAGLPRERVREWLASRHPAAYPEGVHFNNLWVSHAEEIERRIPDFQRAMQQEAERNRQADEAKKQREAEAVELVRAKYGQEAGTVDGLARLASAARDKAVAAARQAEARDGHLNPAELALSRDLANEAMALEIALRVARATGNQ